jgi:hypothetical protein
MRRCRLLMPVRHRTDFRPLREHRHHKPRVFPTQRTQQLRMTKASLTELHSPNSARCGHRVTEPIERIALLPLLRPAQQGRRD